MLTEDPGRGLGSLEDQIYLFLPAMLEGQWAKEHPQVRLDRRRVWEAVAVSAGSSEDGENSSSLTLWLLAILLILSAISGFLSVMSNLTSKSCVN